MKKTRLKELAASADELRKRAEEVIAANEAKADFVEDPASDTVGTHELALGLAAVTEIVSEMYLSQAKHQREVSQVLAQVSEALDSIQEQLDELKEYAAHPLYQWVKEDEASVDEDDEDDDNDCGDEDEEEA